MGASIEDSLVNELIINPRIFVAEAKFSLDEIPVDITIRLYRLPHKKGIWFEQSHYIKTPMQGASYRTSRPLNSDEESAIRQAVNGFLDFYKEAAGKGHEPDESWLEKNLNF